MLRPLDLIVDPINKGKVILRDGTRHDLGLEKSIVLRLIETVREANHLLGEYWLFLKQFGEVVSDFLHFELTIFVQKLGS